MEDGSFAEIIETEKGWNFHFDINGFLLSQYQMEFVLEVLTPLFLENPEMSIIIEGHADSTGTSPINQRISGLRVSNLMYHLEMHGIESSRITKQVKGETEPMAPNTTEEGRALNRRIEINR